MSNANSRVSVIIPTLNAEREIAGLLEALKAQTLKPDEIIIVDSASEDETVTIAQKYNVTKVIHVEQREFDHGRTRDMAFRASTGDFVVFLTQDALPADNNLLAHLLKPFANQKIAVSTGRQVPKSDASKVECLIRSFNYPSISSIRSIDDLSKLGIKTYFSSDVCAAYRRSIYLELDGFDYPIKTNEDMFFAAKAINSGYQIAYTADARVYHSHNLSLSEQYRRNFIQGYEIERHSELLHNAAQISEGKKLVIYVTKELLSKGHLFSIIYFAVDCLARYLGNRAGRKKALKEKSLEG